MSNSEEDNKNGKLHQFQRNNYFYGKLMTVMDFESEQSYFNEKRHLLNRLVHGYGLICGFDYENIKFNSSSGKVEIIFNSGGAALDCCGHEIVVPKGTVKKIVNSTGGILTSKNLEESLNLYLSYKPCLAEMVPAASNPSSCDETCCANRIIEDFEVTASSSLPDESVLPGCPDFSGEINEDEAVTIIKEWIEESSKTCLECDDTDKKLVFLAAVNIDLNLNLTINEGVTGENRRFVCSNNQLYELLRCHLSDFDNPHRALKTINSVGNVDNVWNKPVSNVDITSSDGTIDIITYQDTYKVDVTIASDKVGIRHLDKDEIYKILYSSDDSVTITPNTIEKRINLTTDGANNSSTGLVVFPPESFNNDLEAVSESIDPGLDKGPIGIILGLKHDENDTIFIGAMEQFKSFEFPRALLGAVMNPETGCFQIGVKYNSESETKSSLPTCVQWWAFKPGSYLEKIIVKD